MGIGAISGFQPYVYNTNSVSGSSLNRISAVDNDVTSSHIKPAKTSDYSGETINPLERGETADFAGVLAMQMQMGMNHADMFFGADSVFAG
ncbi:MAG: hypothetical protein E7289_04775 [Lachnospiraceae bacterium]|nr:hypothetical protein [Lachnospiraceae bacterium]